MSPVQFACKASVVFCHYCVMANFFWLLVEALYLNSLLVSSFCHARRCVWGFSLLGWGENSHVSHLFFSVGCDPHAATSWNDFCLYCESRRETIANALSNGCTIEMDVSPPPPAGVPVLFISVWIASRLYFEDTECVEAL